MPLPTKRNHARIDIRSGIHSLISTIKSTSTHTKKPEDKLHTIFWHPTLPHQHHQHRHTDTQGDSERERERMGWWCVFLLQRMYLSGNGGTQQTHECWKVGVCVASREQLHHTNHSSHLEIGGDGRQAHGQGRSAQVHQAEHPPEREEVACSRVQSNLK